MLFITMGGWQDTHMVDSDDIPRILLESGNRYNKRRGRKRRRGEGGDAMSCDQVV